MKVKIINSNTYDNYVPHILAELGIEDIEEYLNPTINSLNDYTLLENIEDGAQLVKETLEHNEKILLVVDCDVDGYTSSAILYQYLKQIKSDISIDIKLHSGKQHGLEDHIDSILKNPIYSLVILPDSSTNDLVYHQMLMELGIKVLVLDHHLAESDVALNAIIVNNQTSPNYPNKDLTGAGIVYQFCRQLDEIFGVQYADNYLDLAALGIDGDMGSLLDIENRYIVHKGFQNIKNFFFKTLINKQSYSMNNEITPISVAFYIVPLINAMIRVGTQEEKQRLFLAFVNGEELVPSQKRGAKGTFEKVAIESARECVNARSRQNRWLEKAENLLEDKITSQHLLDNQVLLICLEEQDDFPSELNGLIAMRMSQKYNKPTIVARLNESEEYGQLISGSARGLNKTELTSFKDYLDQTQLFTYTAGHNNAFGCGISANLVNDFHVVANQELEKMDFGENYYDVNFQRKAQDNDINNIIVDFVKGNHLWGTNVPEPLLYVTNINITKQDVNIMGKNQDTLKIVYNGISYMKFHAKDLIKELADLFDKTSNITLNIIGRANLNEWNGMVTPQIFITDYEVKNGMLEF